MSSTEQVSKQETVPSVSAEEQEASLTTNAVNLFVVTRIGQIRNCMSYIQQRNLTNNFLMIMSSQKDETLRANMTLAASDGPFEKVTVAILPNYPVSPKGFFRRIGIYRSMEQTLQELCTDFGDKPLYLHLHHANSYYPYLIRILEAMDYVPTKTIMLEEGLATYKWAVAPYNLDVYGYRPDRLYWDTPITAVFAKLGKRVLKSIRQIFKGCVSFVWAVIRVFFDIVSCITHTNLYLRCAQLKDCLLPRKYQFGIIDHFDEGWFLYPAKMHMAEQIKIDNCLQLDLETASLALDEDMVIRKLPPVVFASQKYGDYSAYYDTVLTILEEMDIKSVYLKLHPREEPSLVHRALAIARANHPSVIIEECPLLDGTTLETILTSNHFSYVIGLCTTTLFYIGNLDIVTEPISIGDRFMELYPEKYNSIYGNYPAQYHLVQYERDLNLFKEVASDVRQFEVTSGDKE